MEEGAVAVVEEEEEEEADMVGEEEMGTQRGINRSPILSSF